MKFEVKTAGDHYTAEQANKYEELGFTFTPETTGFYHGLFKINGNPEIEINSIEELVEFIKKYDKIIMNSTSIQIYDDYIE